MQHCGVAGVSRTKDAPLSPPPPLFPPPPGLSLPHSRHFAAGGHEAAPRQRSAAAVRPWRGGGHTIRWGGGHDTRGGPSDSGVPGAKSTGSCGGGGGPATPVVGWRGCEGGGGGSVQMAPAWGGGGGADGPGAPWGAELSGGEGGQRGSGLKALGVGRRGGEHVLYIPPRTVAVFLCSKTAPRRAGICAGEGGGY